MSIDVYLLDAASSHDARLVAELVALINDVYETAESGMWEEAATRTTAGELAEMIAAGEIAVAARGDKVAGVVRVHDVADDASEVGMLAAAPDHQGAGVGRALLDFVERQSRERGLRAMRLELLVPRHWRHESKEFLKAWYGRRGYRLIRTDSFGEVYPRLAPLLATPSDLTIYEKPLEPQ
jgi:GNAT superfamily N-acetyltransferase